MMEKHGIMMHEGKGQELDKKEKGWAATLPTLPDSAIISEIFLKSEEFGVNNDNWNCRAEAGKVETRNLGPDRFIEIISMSLSVIPKVEVEGTALSELIQKKKREENYFNGVICPWIGSWRRPK